MTFTDDDLKRLKEDLENFGHKFISIEACYGILARLEAAEDYAMWQLTTSPGISEEHEKRLSAWRKAAGKENP